MLNRFGKFLVNSGSIKPKYMPCHLKWVSHSHTFTGEGETVPVSNAQNKNYLTYTAKDREDCR